jgi:hypothetical protein
MSKQMTIKDVSQMLKNRQISYQTAKQLVYEIENQKAASTRPGE